MTTELRISVRNTSDIGGTALTPVFSAFHDNSFDIYDLGGTASAGLEALAEDGNNSVFAAELAAADADGQSVNVAAARGPIAAGELASAVLDVDGVSNGYFALASMLLPSNDAFIGTANAQQLFDEEGNFTGPLTLTFDGGNVRDAGTEVNTERDAAFINQTGPNTGETEGGVVTVHPGFNGSVGNPDGEQIILGGTNAFGEFIDPVRADFTQPGSGIATVHVNTVARQEGGNGRDFLWGGADDDFINGNGGRDVINGYSGWDVLDGGAGRDILNGGSGNDIINGGSGRDILIGGTGDDDLSGDGGRDFLKGGAGADNLDGGRGRDALNGGDGNDVLAGGRGNDALHGGAGEDVFVFGTNDAYDKVFDFDANGGDRLDLNFDGVESYEDALGYAKDTGKGVQFNFGDGDRLLLVGTEVADLAQDDFIF